MTIFFLSNENGARADNITRPDTQHFAPSPTENWGKEIEIQIAEDD